MQCIQCESETSNPKFCGSSCSATYNNKRYPKRHPEGKCTVCSNPVPSTRKYCPSCRKSGKAVRVFKSGKPPAKYKYRTLGEVRIKYSKYIRAASFNIVRQRARSILIALGRTICEHCGYSLHFEACHIKPICEFSDDALIDTINATDNLRSLCCRCHWEFDNGLLKALGVGNDPTTTRLTDARSA